MVAVVFPKVGEWVAQRIYDWHKRMNMQHNNRRGGLSMFVEIQKIL